MKTVVENERYNSKREEVLSVAVIRASNLLGLNDQQLANTIDISLNNLKKIKTGKSLLKDGSNSFKNAALLVRVFQSIDAIAGGDPLVVKQWMKSRNIILNASPINLIVEKGGLKSVVSYLDSRLALI